MLAPIVGFLKLENIPSQGSGSVFEARSSIENLMSWPFSIRDSGSAFKSQYWRPVGAEDSVAPLVVESIALGLLALGSFAGLADLDGF